MSHLSETDVVHLQQMAHHIRRSVVQMLVAAGSGHLAGSLGMADIFAALYGHVLRHRPDEPDWPERDRLVLSNGHIVPVRYAAMAHTYYFSVDELKTLRQFGSRLQGHPERTHLPGIETTSGPLGEGLSQGCGMAVAGELRDSDARVFVVMSDGEQQCGLTWEAAMFAGARSLGRLTAIIDRNMIQITGSTEEVLPIEPLREKYEAFNWHVLTVDGHDIAMFVDAVAHAQAETERPTVIIANTIPGKGIPAIEGDFHWHGNAPAPDEADAFLKALDESYAAYMV